MPEQWNENFDVIVIGSGFGGSVAITKLVTEGLPGKPNPRVLVLERGTWWRNPEGPGLRNFKQSTPPKILGEWQYWARPNDSLGLAYIADSIYKAHDPLLDAVNPFFKDNDLGIKKNRKGMYRLTRFSDKNGKVDVVSGSAVGGGSLFYSGVNLIPHQPVLERNGLSYLTSGDFQNAGEWMKKFRGKINKINTKIPVPHYMPASPSGDHFQLSRIPESGDVSRPVGYEMPNPNLDGSLDGDFLLLDRARVLKQAMNRVVNAGGFGTGSFPGKVWIGDEVDSGRDGFEPLPLSVVEYDKDTESDSTKKNTFCFREGRCILGCLPSARHTLYKTIQKAQEEDGDITVLPMTKVSYISKSDDYIVHFESDIEGEEGKPTRAIAPIVFLGAGCLGTTEIMLRSKQKHEETSGAEGLALSPMVGQRFSTNGDFFAFTWKMDRDFKTRSEVEDDSRIGNANPTEGPINSSHFYVTFGEGSDRVDVNVEDAGIPSTFARLIHALLPKFNNWQQFMSLAKALVRILLNRNPFPSTEDPDTEARDQVDYLTERELLSGVFFYNLMGSAPDEPFGTFSLQLDGVGLDLSYDDDRKLADWKVFEQQEVTLNQLTKHMADRGDSDRKPELMLSPFWQKEKRVTVVHPLGGCPIGDNVSRGAVDRDGRVYDASSASDTGVYEGLYVVDAAAIPGALAVNPTFTIVTHAVRCLNRVVP